MTNPIRVFTTFFLDNGQMETLKVYKHILWHLCVTRIFMKNHKIPNHRSCSYLAIARSGRNCKVEGACIYPATPSNVVVARLSDILINFSRFAPLKPLVPVVWRALAKNVTNTISGQLGAEFPYTSLYQATIESKRRIDSITLLHVSSTRSSSSTPSSTSLLILQKMRLAFLLPNL